MRWEDFDFESNVIRVPRQITKNGKGRDLPMSAIIKEVLIELRGDGNRVGEVFPGPGDSENSISLRVQTVCNSIGLTDVRLHVLRQTFATRLKDAGVNPFTVRDLLGHAKVQMTDHYTHANFETMKKGVDLLGTKPVCLKFVIG